MALTTRQPATPDGTTTDYNALFPTTPTTHFDKVDEGIHPTPPPPDDGTATTGTWVGSTGNNTVNDFWNMEDMPGDFGDAVDFKITQRTEISGVVDDTVSFLANIFNAAESAAIGTGFSSSFGNHAWSTSTHSAVANTDSATLWDGYKFRSQLNRSNSGMPDELTTRITAMEVDINYDVSTGGDGTDMPWQEGNQPQPVSIGVVPSGPGAL